MSRVPLLVIGGYLGAGKTTLIRQLLRNANGRRLLVLVNDFGAINIDASLIAEADGETIALSNGCVCCAMTGDLFYAVGDALDRRPRPDAIIIEASGVADPARIASVALAEPDLSHGGVVTLVDAENIAALLRDHQIGPQLAAQIKAADLLVLSRTDRVAPDAALSACATLTGTPHVEAPYGALDAEILFGLDPAAPLCSHDHDHGSDFASWSGEYRGALPKDALRRFLEAPLDGLFRMKGWVRDDEGSHEIHRVGDRLDLHPSEERPGSRLVAIGPAASFRPDVLERKWRRLTAI